MRGIGVPILIEGSVYVRYRCAHINGSVHVPLKSHN